MPLDELRDWFATNAANALIRSYQPQELTEPLIKSIAELSYKIADAMLRQRKKD